jgi:phosphotransferase system enzyme I (PtsP)
LRQDIARSVKSSADAVGLFRTEIPFFSRSSFPTEDEQIEIYREQLAAFSPRAVTMRTLDIGGDKDLPYFPIEEENPFLGCRSIRWCLANPGPFRAQIRAILRAGKLGPVRLMLPMITSISELDLSLQIIDEVSDELRRKEIPFDENIPIGVMGGTVAGTDR